MPPAGCAVDTVPSQCNARAARPLAARTRVEGGSMPARDVLAIVGGQPVIPPGRHRQWPDVTPEDRKAVLAALDRGVLCGANGPEITALQRDWADFLGAENCLA